MKIALHRSPVPVPIQRRYAALPLCAGWTRRDVARLDQVADRVEYEPGDLVLAQGLAHQEFVVLVRGKACFVDYATGRRCGDLRAGDWTGHEALLAGTPQPLSVVASGYAEALHVGAREFVALVQQCPSLAAAICVPRQAAVPVPRARVVAREV